LHLLGARVPAFRAARPAITSAERPPGEEEHRMVKLTFRYAIPLAIAAALSACDRPAADEGPGEAIVRSVEGVDEATLAAFPEGAIDLIEEGRELYVVCSVCHGLGADGTALGPSLVGPDWIHISGEIEEIEEIVRTGVRNPVEYPIPMPAMGGGDFDPGELRALATYLYALGGGTY
jgi:mono/diheme cytochrome c family protein